LRNNTSANISAALVNVCLIGAEYWRPNAALTEPVLPEPRCVDGEIPRLETDRRTPALEVCAMNKFEKDQKAPRMLVADDDPSVLRVIADRCTRMGFEVETATNGLKSVIKASQYDPDILVVDVHMPEVDGLSVCGFLHDVAKQLPHVLVMTGRPGQEIIEKCKGIGAFCVHKGPNFWNEFEARLVEIYPQKAIAIRQSVRPWEKIEVKKRPRVLLVDDDISVKKQFFRRFSGLGADLIYAVDGMQGFWKARREEPTVIVADYCMPNGDAEYLLARLRNAAETRSIPVIVHTGRRLSDPIKQRLRQQIGGHRGAARILQKSHDSQELFEALQRLCGFASDLDGELLYQ
jgi:CheY-like chemotaxis protein